MLYQVWHHYFMTLEEKDLFLFYVDRMGQKVVSVCCYFDIIAHVYLFFILHIFIILQLAVCIKLSVRLSVWYTPALYQKQLNIRLCKQRHVISQGL